MIECEGKSFFIRISFDCLRSRDSSISNQRFSAALWCFGPLALSFPPLLLALRGSVASHFSLTLARRLKANVESFNDGIFRKISGCRKRVNALHVRRLRVAGRIRFFLDEFGWWAEECANERFLLHIRGNCDSEITGKIFGILNRKNVQSLIQLLFSND